MEQTQAIRTWLKAGLIAKLVQLAIQLGLWAIQKPLLAGRNLEAQNGLTGAFTLAVLPAMFAGISFVLYVILKSYAEQPPAPDRAAVPLTIAVALPLALSLCSTVISLVTRMLTQRLYTLETLAAVSTISSYQSFTGILGSFSTLSFAVAAGMLYWRAKHAPQ